jgi:hypothetical protein
MIFFQKCKILRLTYDFKSQTVITTKKKIVHLVMCLQ